MSSVRIALGKLQPPRLAGAFVARGELLARLEAGSGLPLRVLSAPAGYGKTSLLAHWLDAREGLSAWVSLDRDDSDPVVFVSYVVAALRTAIPAAGMETLSCLNAGQQLSLAALAASLGNDLAMLSVPLVLVLDDYHRIDSPQTHALLDRLLAHPAGSLQLVLSGRQDPPLSLGALRVREAVDEIRLRELKFNERETATLIERCAGRAVPAAALASLQQRSEGWPAGVRLAALALRQGGAADDFAPAFSSSTRELEQYFVEEVLAQQSPLARDCLLKTSILERFSAPLCAAVLGASEEGDGQAFMRLVSSGGLLCVAIDDSLGWYRHQHLFREFLQRQLASQHTAAAIAALHRRAAAWLEEQGMLEEAIPHALAGAGATAAGQLLARHRSSLINREQRQRLVNCLYRLPPDTVEHHPELLLLKAWLMHHQGRHLETPAVLDRIEALAGSAAAGVDPLRGSVLALRSLQRYLEGRADLALACADEAFRCLPADCPQARVIAQMVVAGARQMSGDLPGARQYLYQALARAAGPVDVCQAPLVTALCFVDWMAADLSALQWTIKQNCRLGDARPGSDGGQALARYFRALVQYQRNDLAQAEITLLPAVDPQHAPHLGYRTEISFLQAAIHQALGQADRAREMVDAVCERLLQNGDLPALFRAQACQADLALRQGRTEVAQEWARNFDPGPVQFVYRFFSAPHLTLARVWIAEGTAESNEQAGRLLQLLEAELSARHNHRFLIEVLALRALQQHQVGEEVLACELLRRAIALAQPGGFIRLFVDLGQQLATLLKRLDPGKGNSGYLGQILSAFNDDWLVSAGRQRVGADLTRRELKILKLLAVRLSNFEISEELCISRATVKRHTQNIYRKLRASSRREAVVRARSLNILLEV